MKIFQSFKKYQLRKKNCDFEEIFLEMTNDKDTIILEKMSQTLNAKFQIFNPKFQIFNSKFQNFQFQISNFHVQIFNYKFQVSNFKDKIFFKELQKSIKFFLLKMKKFKSRKNKWRSHILKQWKNKALII